MLLWSCVVVVVVVMSVLANGKGLRCRLLFAQDSRAGGGEVESSRDGERASMGLPSLACPHYKPSHHLAQKHGYHSR